ncbi:MAG: ABC transporter ATP-binding protein [Haloferacaceae archaeon]
MTVAVGVRDRLPPRWLLLFAAVVLATEAVASLLYLSTLSVTVVEPRYALYPFVWINLGVLAVAATRVPDASRRTRLLAAGVGVGYFFVLTAIDGTIALGGTGSGLRVMWLPPGWGPALLYSGGTLRLALFPFKLVGYASLAYLVAVTVVDAAEAAVVGVVGLVSCVSCTAPIATSLLAGVVGGAGAVGSAVYAWSYDLSTLVFVVSVVLLYWRPTFGVGRA